MPDLTEAYRRAYRIRRVEEEISRRYHPDPGDRSESPMRCPVHLSVGQECISVGVAMAVEDHELTMHGDDYRGAYWPNGRPHVWLNHRGHAPYLAFGGSLQRMLDELHGRATGCSGGRAGSMHLHASDSGIIGGSPIVGSSISMATGSAWAAKLDGIERLTVVFCGDAALETGQAFESLNFAALHGLRLIYVIEDNGVATATPKHVRSSVPIKRRIEAWLPVHSCGDTFERVHETARELLTAAAFPSALLIKTTRACAHVGPEIDYNGLAHWDPVKVLHDTAFGPSTHAYLGCGQIEEGIDQEIATAFQTAEAALWPSI